VRPTSKVGKGSNRRFQSAFRERSRLAPRASRLCHIPSTTGFLARGTGGVGLSGRRGEIGNHKVAGKIGVTTMAALPRNHLYLLDQKPGRSAGASSLPVPKASGSPPVHRAPRSEGHRSIGACAERNRMKSMSSCFCALCWLGFAASRARVHGADPRRSRSGCSALCP
jgi:hypothetical protein